MGDIFKVRCSTRLDVYVLCKLCTVLECEIQDLLVFHPSGEE